jgi:hypothetical protein
MIWTTTTTMHNNLHRIDLECTHHLFHSMAR